MPELDTSFTLASIGNNLISISHDRSLNHQIKDNVQKIKRTDGGFVAFIEVENLLWTRRGQRLNCEINANIEIEVYGE